VGRDAKSSLPGPLSGALHSLFQVSREEYSDHNISKPFVLGRNYLKSARDDRAPVSLKKESAYVDACGYERAGSRSDLRSSRYLE
jgi:hypothetical protein